MENRPEKGIAETVAFRIAVRGPAEISELSGQCPQGAFGNVAQNLLFRHGTRLEYRRSQTGSGERGQIEMERFYGTAAFQIIFVDLARLDQQNIARIQTEMHTVKGTAVSGPFDQQNLIQDMGMPRIHRLFPCFGIIEILEADLKRILFIQHAGVVAQRFNLQTVLYHSSLIRSALFVQRNIQWENTEINNDGGKPAGKTMILEKTDIF